MKPMFILGYYGFKNAGDDAMLYSLLREFHVLNKDWGYRVLSMNHTAIPSEVVQSVECVPLTIPKTIAALAKSSCIILGGGTHLYSYGKRLKSFVVNARILMLGLSAKLLRKKFYMLSVGIGTFNSWLNQLLAKWSCKLATHILVRDRASLETLNSWGCAQKSSLSFDVSALLGNGRIGDNIGMKVLGLSITPVYEVYHRQPGKDERIIDSISFAVNKLLDNDSELEVALYVFNGGKNGDKEFTESLYCSLFYRDRVSIIDYEPNPEMMLDKVAQCSYFVSMRYHAGVYAYLLKIPQIIIEYMPKCRMMSREIWLPEHAILSLDEVLDGKFNEASQLLIKYPDMFMARKPIKETVGRVKMACQNYKSLLDCICRF